MQDSHNFLALNTVKNELPTHLLITSSIGSSPFPILQVEKGFNTFPKD